MVQVNQWSYFSHGRTPRVSCPHSLMRDIDTSSQATLCVEEDTHLQRGAACSGVCSREAGSRCPSLSQRREGTPAPGEWARTVWSSWAGGMQRRLQRQSPVTETARETHLPWNIPQGVIIWLKLVLKIQKLKSISYILNNVNEQRLFCQMKALILNTILDH